MGNHNLIQIQHYNTNNLFWKIMLIALDFNAPDNYNFIMASSMHLAVSEPCLLIEYGTQKILGHLSNLNSNIGYYW